MAHRDQSSTRGSLSPALQSPTLSHPDRHHFSLTTLCHTTLSLRPTIPVHLTLPVRPAPPVHPAPHPPHGWPTNASYQSYYSASTSPLSYLSTNSSSTRSSTLSVPFTVTSINSYKSRKNVLYPRRVHPAPVPVASQQSVSPDVRLSPPFCHFYQIRILLSLHRP
jgi:hypothetical protein